MVNPLNYEPDLDKVQRFSRIDGVWVPVDENWKPTGEAAQPDEHYGISEERSDSIAKLFARGTETGRKMIIPGANHEQT
jgi:hypothetical protein